LPETINHTVQRHAASSRTTTLHPCSEDNGHLLGRV
jgi:hypothetical protein